MAGPTVAGSKRTYVLQFSCRCEDCPNQVQKHLKRILGIGSILKDVAEGKVTISGSMVDQCTVETGLKKWKKNWEEKATLFSEEIPIENIVKDEQIVLRKSEVREGQSKVVLRKPADIQSEHKQKLETKNIIEKKQIVLRKSEVREGQNKAVLCKPADIQSKHEHELELKNFNKRFTCDGCKEDGFGSRHRCEKCDYDLHHDCMSPEPTVSHELFKGSIFEFSNERPTHMISCNACENEIHGYFYHCKAKNLSLHPCCIKLKSRRIRGLTFSLKNKASSKCFWCNVKSEKGVNSGWSYVSECENYQFHVKCIVQKAQEDWKKKVDEDLDVYSMVLAESLIKGLVGKSKRNGWSRGAKFVGKIILIARTIIGILFGDPTAIVAPIVDGLLKN